MCLQDTEDYSISDRNGIKEVSVYIQIQTIFREMVSFQEEREFGSLLVHIEEMRKHVGRNVWPQLR